MVQYRRGEERSHTAQAASRGRKELRKEE